MLQQTRSTSKPVALLSPLWANLTRPIDGHFLSKFTCRDAATVIVIPRQISNDYDLVRPPRRTLRCISAMRLRCWNEAAIWICAHEVGAVGVENERNVSANASAVMDRRYREVPVVRCDVVRCIAHKNIVRRRWRAGRQHPRRESASKRIRIPTNQRPYNGDAHQQPHFFLPPQYHKRLPTLFARIARRLMS